MWKSPNRLAWKPRKQEAWRHRIIPAEPSAKLKRRSSSHRSHRDRSRLRTVRRGRSMKQTKRWSPHRSRRDLSRHPRQGAGNLLIRHRERLPLPLPVIQERDPTTKKQTLHSSQCLQSSRSNQCSPSFCTLLLITRPPSPPDPTPRTLHLTHQATTRPPSRPALTTPPVTPTTPPTTRTTPSTRPHPHLQSLRTLLRRHSHRPCSGNSSRKRNERKCSLSVEDHTTSRPRAAQTSTSSRSDAGTASCWSGSTSLLRGEFAPSLKDYAVRRS